MLVRELVRERYRERGQRDGRGSQADIRDMEEERGKANIRERTCIVFIHYLYTIYTHRPIVY